jgi:hypothetical protein
MASTSPAEDVQALRAALIQVLHTAPFDDMLWPEMQAALQLVVHDIQVTVSVYGSFNNAPVPPPPELSRSA